MWDKKALFEDLQCFSTFFFCHHSSSGAYHSALPPPHECLMLQAHGLSLCIMALRGHESFIVLSTFSLPLPGANFPPFETLRVFSIQDAAFNGCMTPTAWP